mgnify:CR=1 FL=1
METTKSFKKYIQLYGPHFNKLLCEFAVDLMETQSGKITPFTKAQIEEKLKTCGIKLEYNKLEDFVYVANMCKADFLGQSVINDDRHLCLYIKNVIDDPDGYDGQVFYRWLTDMEKMGIPVDWAEFL